MPEPISATAFQHATGNEQATISFVMSIRIGLAEFTDSSGATSVGFVTTEVDEDSYSTQGKKTSTVKSESEKESTNEEIDTDMSDYENYYSDDFDMRSNVTNN